VSAGGQQQPNFPSFESGAADKAVRVRVKSVAHSREWLAALEGVLRDARSGALEPNWREYRPEMALLGLGDVQRNPESSKSVPGIPASDELGHNPLVALGQLKILRKPRWEWETEYLALLEIVGTPVWEWEPGAAPNGGWAYALGAWYALSVECVNARAVSAMEELSWGRAAHRFEPHMCLMENRWQESFQVERDLLTESYQAGLCAGGWVHADCIDGVDWIGNARRRTGCWRDERQRERHLMELSSEEYCSRLERLPDYWRPSPMLKG
jgi:hypothetical protein